MRKELLKVFVLNRYNTHFHNKWGLLWIFQRSDLKNCEKCFSSLHCEPKCVEAKVLTPVSHPLYPNPTVWITCLRGFFFSTSSIFTKQKKNHFNWEIQIKIPNGHSYRLSYSLRIRPINHHISRNQFEIPFSNNNFKHHHYQWRILKTDKNSYR